MTIQEIRQYCQDLSNKDSKGDGFTLLQFNNGLKFAVISRFENTWKLAQEISASEKRPLAEVIFEMGDLRHFVKREELTMGSMGSIGGIVYNYLNYPEGFRYTIGMSANNIPVAVMRYALANNKRSGVLIGNLDENPVAFEGDGHFEIIPNDVEPIVLTYLRKPATPYYDYCLSSDDLETFMPVGSRVQWSKALAQWILYDENGKLMLQEVTRDDFTDHNKVYTSQTIELDYEDTKHKEIADEVLAQLGVNLRAPEIVQYAQKPTQ